MNQQNKIKTVSWIQKTDRWVPEGRGVGRRQNEGIDGVVTRGEQAAVRTDMQLHCAPLRLPNVTSQCHLSNKYVHTHTGEVDGNNTVQLCTCRLQYIRYHE